MEISTGTRRIGRSPLVLDLSDGDLPEIRALYQKQSCIRCPLSQTRKTIVWGRAVMRSAEVMVIGVVPGKEEDSSGSPFVDEFSELLTKIWQDVGLRVSDLCVTLLNKCYSPSHRLPTALERAQCFPFLLREIKQVSPKVIVCLGAYVFKALTGQSWKTDTGDPVLGVQLRDDHRIWNAGIVPTYHPASWLKMSEGTAKQEILQRMISDWALVAGIIYNYTPDLRTL